MKVCTVCNTEKDDEQFNWKIKKNNLRQARCKPCRSSTEKSKNKEWYDRVGHLIRKENYDPISKQIYNKQYGIDNKEAICLRKKEYYKENQSLLLLKRRNYTANNIEQVRQRARQRYHDSDKTQYYANNALRRASKLQATPAWSETEQIVTLYKEAKILEEETGIKQHIDHRVPLKNPLVCGLHCISNLQILSASANLSKHNRFII